MVFQEIIAVAIVGIAALFALRTFIRQFTSGDGGAKCAKCAFNQLVQKPKTNSATK